MDHQAAVREHAAERYILGELPADERDRFEEHLSDCSRCMDDVVALDVFAANTRPVFAGQASAATAPPARWFDRFMPRFAPALAFSGALNLALLLFVGYGALRVIPALHSRISDFAQPRASEVFVVHGVSRAASAPFQVSQSGAWPIFRFDVPQQFRSYSYSMEGPAGYFRPSGPLHVAPNSETVDLTLPLAGLNPGVYRVRVTGSDESNSQEVSSWTFQVTP